MKVQFNLIKSMDILTQWRSDTVGQTTSGQLEQPNGYRGMGNSAEDGSELSRVVKLKSLQR